MANSLKIGLIHMAVKYKDVGFNALTLLDMNIEAARTGHQIILNTEMSLSGYSFLSREDAFPYTLSRRSGIVEKLRKTAAQYRVYICLGFAEQEIDSPQLFNTAIILGPEGEICAHYRKINAEARWACPGNPVQDNCFNTPWGRVGVLTCSDTYHGLIPRVSALKGADLILVPANWPAGPGNLDPRELWAVRARENGVYLAACNRGGKDRFMIYDNAPSGLFDPLGNEIQGHSGSDSCIVSCDLPLDGKNRLAGVKREEIMVARTPEAYGPIYLDMRHVAYDGMTLAEYYDMQGPAPFEVHCHTGRAPEVLTKACFDQAGQDRYSFFVFPCMEAHDCSGLAASALDSIRGQFIAICFSAQKDEDQVFLVQGDQEKVTILRKSQRVESLNIMDVGPARIGFLSARDLMSPEMGMAHAKLGCDFMVCSTGELDPADQRVMASRTLDQTGVVLSGHNLAFVAQPPEGHNRWSQVLAGYPEICSTSIYLERAREKRFQDRIDFNTLLGPQMK